MERQFKHLSIRVPWHDTGWDGRVCSEPELNSSCLKLRGIATSRDDLAERSVAGQSIEMLPQQKWPCCVHERMAFMAPFSYERVVEHPYKRTSQGSHGHFAPTTLRHPRYSAPAVPFAWMLRESMEKLGQEFGIDVQSQREPDLGFKTQWIQDQANQKALSECFSSQLAEEQSLCFFYAKKVPFVEDSGARVLIGVGRLLNIAPCVEYDYSVKDLSGKLRSILWERVVQHSIRPDCKDGFILPYHAAMKFAEVRDDFDITAMAAFSPEDRLLEFSHGSQLVTHDGAIASLLALADSLRYAHQYLPGPWDKCLGWIDTRLNELWKARGAFPGLGSALCAFGIELGTFVARSITERIGIDDDPWDKVEQIMAGPNDHLPSYLAKGIDSTLRAKWNRLPVERRDLLKLVSRFELDRDQAKLIYVQELRRQAGIRCSDLEILVNPYFLYELTRLTENPISLWSIDRGVFPDEAIRQSNPLSEPTALASGADARRVRALTVSVLERQAENGDTLIAQDQLVLAVRRMPIRPSCDLDSDLLAVAKDTFEGAVTEVSLANGEPALQLGRLAEMGAVIRSACLNRSKGVRLAVKANWRALLDDYLNRHGSGTRDELEDRARQEKTAALTELAESRLSVLIGPAGTGKTTLLSVLCSHPDIASGDILLLAPTGKARVRMEQAAGARAPRGYTIAQFLTPHRYNAPTGRYLLSSVPAEPGAQTVIVDEASMLTEEMLAALLQALRGVHRLILIGDPRQLPPIGAGRPFVDIVNYLSPPGIKEMFPKVGPGFAELTIRRRQSGEERADLQLAEWFSGNELSPGEDDIFDTVKHGGHDEHLRLVEWNTPSELRDRLTETLVSELGLKHSDDVDEFDSVLGGKEWNGFRFFNLGAAQLSEKWQILSPIKSGPQGVPELNRLIHKRFRQRMLDAARKERRKIAKPMGPEEIVYGDKVINVVNTDPNLPWNKHRKVYPSKADPYIANGEIGMVVGFYRRQGLPDLRWKLEVEFASQPGYKYDFTGKDFGEDANPVLELAYALTVHKAQGSEFGTVILILPNPCRILTRELLYTALTRQRDRVLVLHQGAASDLRKYTLDNRSEIARRLTNLFRAPQPVAIEERFFDEFLIHRTARGEMVRSKSEVIIADRLAALGVEYSYERPLTIGGVTKYPDFTIQDMESGRTFYWEHCGMMQDPDYRRRWEKKIAWYASNGVTLYSEGSGAKGTLIVSSDSQEGAIDSRRIEEMILEIVLKR